MPRPSHQVFISTAYRLNLTGELSEDLWRARCTCGWNTTTAFLHTAQKAMKEHLGLRVDWASEEIEVFGKE